MEMQLRFLSAQDYSARIAARRKMVDSWRKMTKWKGDPPYNPPLLRQSRCPFFEPGLVFYMTDEFDPKVLYIGDHPDHKRFLARRDRGMYQAYYHQERLTQAYWNNWSEARPPIGVTCPDGTIWEIDAWDQSGDEWLVDGYPEQGDLCVDGLLLINNMKVSLRDGKLLVD